SPATDRKVLAAMLKRYSQDIAPEFHPSFYKEINQKFKGDYAAYAEKLFSKSIFASEEALNAFLDKPKQKKLTKDPAYQAGLSVINQYRELIKMNQDAEQRIEQAS